MTTRTVYIGDIPMGGNHPVRIQSMTNTPTLDTKSTAGQIIRIALAGGDFVRVTTQNLKEAENLSAIKKEIIKRGYKIPLVADTHFNAKIAGTAARIVEKIRINPGNFIGTKEKFEYTDKENQLEIEKIHGTLLPLLKICKENGTAIRIGSNHGSLSGRIMGKYGDTTQGMVESVMEFIRICMKENFMNIVVSMKASNTHVMVQANRLLVHRMAQEGMDFPLHLGITEAGGGEDGRIKSAVGIGALLADGIGDTIRVSLTEEPEMEIPVARKLAEYFSSKRKEGNNHFRATSSSFTYKKRNSIKIYDIGGNNDPVVIQTNENYLQTDDILPDYLFRNNAIVSVKNPENESLVLSVKEYMQTVENIAQIHFVQVNIFEFSAAFLKKLKKDTSCVLVLNMGKANAWAVFNTLKKESIPIPVILQKDYRENELENLQIKASSDFGALFIDGYGDGIWIKNDVTLKAEDVNSLAFGILQASRVRVSKTEYISCPGCGRTLFNLQETTLKIREQTAHLKGLKIGIMGCIVNGPGEMADADYGYVGSGIGKITLYKGKEVVKRNILSKNAVEELIKLIKDHGDWKPP